MSRALISRPLARRTRRRQVTSWLISRMARIGSRGSGRVAPSRSPRAWPAGCWSCHLQEGGVLAHVGVADDDVEPRKRSASAWGSSRVLMIGRERVVAEDTPPRCARPAGSRRTPHRGQSGGPCRLRVDLPAHEERDEDLGVAVEVVVALGQVVLVAPIRVPAESVLFLKR